jgi:GGDEF domain-containing protein
MNVDARLDPETGLYTKHFFGMLFNHEITRTHRYPAPLVLLRVATQYDAPAGNKKPGSPDPGIANLLFHSIRHVDVTAQYGEDYLILLPATDEKGGTVVGQRLLQRLQRAIPAQSGGVQPSSIHIGLAAHAGGPGASAETILVQASEALEEARHRGKNALVNFREITTLKI